VDLSDVERPKGVDELPVSAGTCVLPVPDVTVVWLETVPLPSTD
jgi:hypothetical protein